MTDDMYTVSWVCLLPTIRRRIDPAGAIVDFGTRRNSWIYGLKLVKDDETLYPCLFYRTTCQRLLPYRTRFYARGVWRDNGDVSAFCQWVPTDYRPYGFGCIRQDGNYVGSATDYMEGITLGYSPVEPPYINLQRGIRLSWSRHGQKLWLARWGAMT